jgi:hypothetical protein
MGYAEDLLEQAEHLAKRELKKPKQASLRRSVSAAYYALFHLLVCDAAKRFSPQNPNGLQQLWQRAFGHGEMKEICSKFASGAHPKNLKLLLSAKPSGHLVIVAKAFVDLQEARHRSDYDLSEAVSRQYAIDQIKIAQNAFDAWDNVRNTPDAAVFLSALLLSRRWSK